MTHRPIYLIDQAAARIASLEAATVGDHFEGTISLESTPPDMKRLFEEYEEIVEGQVLSLLDEIEDKIATLRLQAVFDNGLHASICDLQVFPTTHSVSFKTCQRLPV
jgi:hypothetical protein